MFLFGGVLRKGVLDSSQGRGRLFLLNIPYESFTYVFCSGLCNIVHIKVGRAARTNFLGSHVSGEMYILIAYLM